MIAQLEPARSVIILAQAGAYRQFPSAEGAHLRALPGLFSQSIKPP